MIPLLIYLAMVVPGQKTAATNVAPLPLIEHRECSVAELSPGKQFDRNLVTLRNVHNAALVGWTLRWSDPANPRSTSWTTSDRVFSPSRVVRPGEVVVERWVKPCQFQLDVVAAHYEDGTTAGEEVAVNRLFEIRSERIGDIAVILSVLKATRIGESAVASRADIDALLAQIDDARARHGRGTVLEILSESATSRHLFGVLATPPRKVSKAELVAVLEAGVSAVRNSAEKAGR